jgi:hypothetical protein
MRANERDAAFTDVVDEPRQCPNVSDCPCRQREELEAAFLNCSGIVTPLGLAYQGSKNEFKRAFSLIIAALKQLTFGPSDEVAGAQV